MSIHSVTEPVLSAAHDHVMVLTINRPEAANAIDLDVTRALGSALESADRDPDIRVVVLTGAGSRHFCAGADLRFLAAGGSLRLADEPAAAWGFAGVVNHAVSVPIIAAVNGTAHGGGTELALACDLVIAARGATFALPEVRRGIVAAAGGAFRVARQIPAKAAMQMLLTGDPVDAEQAQRYGLVNEVVAADDLLPRALELAGRIAANAPLAVQATKRIARGIVDGAYAAEEDLWVLSDRERAAVLASQDAKEGPRAFAEKRAPKWSGR